MQHHSASHQNTQTFSSAAEGWMMARHHAARSQHSDNSECRTTGECQQQTTRNALAASYCRKLLA